MKKLRVLKVGDWVGVTTYTEKDWKKFSESEQKAENKILKKYNLL